MVWFLSDLCNAQNITGYPQLNLYKKGARVDTFRHPREHDVLFNYLAENADPKLEGVHATTPKDDVPEWVKLDSGCVFGRS
jgi:hypothetical protein